MTTVATLGVEIIANVTGLRTGLAEAAGSALSFGNVLKGALIGVAGFAVLEAGIRGISAAFNDSLGAAKEFQSAMAIVQAHTQATAAEMPMLTDGILRMATQSNIGAKDMAQGLYFIESAGYHATDALQVLDAVNKGVTVGLGTEAQVGSAVTSVLKAYHLTAADATGVIATLNMAIAEGKVPIDELITGLGRAMPMAAAVGISFDQLAAAVATATQVGIPASVAYTGLSGVIQALYAPTKTTIAALGQLGLSVDQARQEIQDKGLFAVIDEWNQKLGGNLDTLKELIPNIRAWRGAIAETGQYAKDNAQNVADMSKKYDHLKDSLAAVTATAEYQTQRLGNNFQVLGIAIGQTALPAITEFNKALADGMAKINNGDFAGGITRIVGTVQSALGQIGSVIDSFVGGMFSAGWNLIASFAQGIVDGASSLLTQAINAVSDMIASFLIGNSPPPQGPLSQIDRGGRVLMQTYGEGMQQGLGPVQDAVSGVAGAFADLGSQSSQAVQAAAGDLQSLKAAARDVTAQIHDLDDALTALKEQTDALQFQADGIKQSYEDQIAPLQDALDVIKSQVDYSRQLHELQNKIKENDLARQALAAEGDPVKKAELQAELQNLDLKKKQDELDQRRAGLAKRKHGASPEQLRVLDDEQKQLDIQKQMAGLTDRVALAKIKQQKAQLTEQDKSLGLDKQQHDLQKKMAALPLEQKIAALKDQEKEALKPLQQHLKELQHQTKELELQKQHWQNIKNHIDDATKALQGAAKALHGARGGAGLHGLHGLPKPGGSPGGGDPTKTLVDKLTEDMKKAAQKAGQSLGDGIRTGFQDWIAHNGSRLQTILVSGLTGAIAGGAAFGPIGAIIGGALGLGIGKSLTDDLNKNLAVERFKSRLRMLGDHLRPEVAGIGKSLGAIFGGGDKAQGELQLATIIKDQFGPQAAEGVTQLVQAFERLGDALGKYVGPALQQLGAFVKDHVLPVLAALGKTLLGLEFQILIDEINFVSTTIGLIGNAFSTLGTGADTLKTFIGDAFSTPQAVEGVTKLVHALERLGDALGKYVGPALQQFGAFVKDHVLPVLAALGQYVGPALQQFGASVKDQVLPVLAALGKMLLGLAFQKLVDTINDIGKNIVETGDAFSTFGKTIRDIGTAFSVLGGDADNLKNVVGTAFSLLTESIQSDQIIIGKAFSNIGRAADHLKTIVGTAFSVLGGDADNLKNVVGTAFSLLGGDADLLKTVVGTAFSTLGTDVQTLQTNVGTAFDAMGTTINDKIEAAKTKLGEITTTVDTLARDIGGKALSVGVNLVTGVINGIRSKLGDLKSMVQGWAEALPQWMRDKLGIQSPSTVFATLALEIPAGVVQGLTAGRPRVEQALTRLTAPPGVSAFAAAGTTLPVSAATPALADQQQTVLLTEIRNQLTSIDQKTGQPVTIQDLTEFLAKLSREQQFAGDRTRNARRSDAA